MSALSRKRTRRYRLLRGAMGPRWPALESLWAPKPARGRYIAAVALGLLVYAALGYGIWRGGGVKREPRTMITANVELRREVRPLPPMAEQPPAPARHLERQARRSLTPPAAAQAGKVIARAPEPSAPLDLTGFDMVQGKSESYAGGYTASSGTSSHAIDDPSATARGSGPSSNHFARVASPARKDWACAWPEQAVETDLRDARVSIRVRVTPDGSPEQVDVLSTAVAGFAEAARGCALSETYRAALDPDGHRIAGLTSVFVVHFVR